MNSYQRKNDIPKDMVDKIIPASDARAILGDEVLTRAIKSGKIKRYKHGLYYKEQIEAYRKELDERKAIPKPKWIYQGTTVE